VSLREDYGPFLLLGAGIVMLSYAYKRGPRKIKGKVGDRCNPEEDAPPGFHCAPSRNGYILQRDKEYFIGYGSYLNRPMVNDVLAELGFSGGNLSAFQTYMNKISEWELPTDGQVDRDSMLALEEAETMLEQGQWPKPRWEQQ
jgi:hypothetical protein